MINFVTVRGEAFPLITDLDFCDARAAMLAVDIDELPVYRANTDDVDDLAGEVADCDVVETSLKLVAIDTKTF